MPQKSGPPPRPIITNVEGNEYTRLIGRDAHSTTHWSRDENPWRRKPARAALYVMSRKWHVLFFAVVIASGTPLLLMASEGIFSPGLLILSSGTLLVWAIFAGIDRERRRGERNPWDHAISA
ncbi:hypothetical protein E8E12_006973 [Didymella heteroderae]|uniref:Uncharacterized protein n=1 Tax=Didymella heteroderae TaxID=1769908 RepID=A0A9P4WQW6_9PLEO|nr:hypothetical protein E8E12_006973 [Didymella heteroderae]